MNTGLILGIFSYFAMTSFVLAQTATGVIRGTVQDRTGAVLVDAHVTLRDEATSQTREQTTNQVGLFDFQALPFGSYTLEVDHPQFTKQVTQNIVLQVAETKDLTVTLQVGAADQSVVVQGNGGLRELVSSNR